MYELGTEVRVSGATDGKRGFAERPDFIPKTVFVKA
jgi:hypothetical protein